MQPLEGFRVGSQKEVFSFEIVAIFLHCPDNGQTHLFVNMIMLFRGVKPACRCSGPHRHECPSRGADKVAPCLVQNRVASRTDPGSVVVVVYWLVHQPRRWHESNSVVGSSLQVSVIGSQFKEINVSSRGTIDVMVPLLVKRRMLQHRLAAEVTVDFEKSQKAARISRKPCVRFDTLSRSWSQCIGRLVNYSSSDAKIADCNKWFSECGVKRKYLSRGQLRLDLVCKHEAYVPPSHYGSEDEDITELEAENLETCTVSSDPPSISTSLNGILDELAFNIDPSESVQTEPTNLPVPIEFAELPITPSLQICLFKPGFLVFKFWSSLQIYEFHPSLQMFLLQTYAYIKWSHGDPVGRTIPSGAAVARALSSSGSVTRALSSEATVAHPTTINWSIAGRVLWIVDQSRAKCWSVICQVLVKFKVGQLCRTSSDVTAGGCGTVWRKIDSGVQCDQCGSWYHGCIWIREEELGSLQEHEWRCEECADGKGLVAVVEYKLMVEKEAQITRYGICRGEAL
ncbi:hypothetical protein PR048_030393 [Dryococelus australis]|uniref:Uncharacterized protein n=1 Tax=Dryococelus australis TaxID=614101 RepID=A0ABQ9G8W2_9NEOP|nr:hypothetical protein PR048_030393 [Dryococelus australis]